MAREERERAAEELDDAEELELEEVCPGCGLDKRDWKGNGGQGYTLYQGR